MLMADRIAVMNNGQVEQYATPQEIYDQPATPFVAEFVGGATGCRSSAAATAMPRLAA